MCALPPMWRRGDVLTCGQVPGGAQLCPSPQWGAVHSHWQLWEAQGPPLKVGPVLPLGGCGEAEPHLWEGLASRGRQPRTPAPFLHAGLPRAV